MRTPLLLAAPLAALPLLGASAQEAHRELDAHVHGHATLLIAQEGAALAMELEAPGADIVGFEHAPESEADRAAVDAAEARLAEPLALFGLPAAAGCAVVSASAHLVLGEGHEDAHDDAHGHDDDHAHDDDHEGDHDDDHDDGHADHEDDHHDDHDAHEAAGGHAEFHAEYQLTCDAPAAIATLDFAGYFSAFAGAQEVETQILSDRGARAFEASRDAPRLDLDGGL